ncbi:tyrosine-type recombinase/integrase [Motiliproteus sediminis]|uniref:tyrosine-type recombinase/integrase n=1 Tax=Motiliproteus sediminis TaxID=1468178 RepID=UPI001AEFE576|nr:site-specific integrase [Motiliproteus sediminis]
MLGEKPRRTWQEAVVRWLADTQEKADHQKDVGKLKWLDTYLRDRYLDQIDRDLIDEIGRIKRAESSPSTANRYLALMRAILRMARNEWDWIDKVPHFRLYREPQKRVRWLRPKEADRLLKELPPHLEVMARFSLATGLRQRNVSYLRWEQVNLATGMAWIHADQSKSRKAFAVPLNQDALQVLIGQQGQHPEYCFTYHGEPVDRTTTKAWYKALKRAGISDFRWHDLRHTWASWHVQNGTSLYELMELGGWSSFEMVLRYAHMAGEHLRKAAGHVDGTVLTHPRNNKGLRLIASL